jgi:steroid delta-isomerase-like uncharacterized protein
VTTAVRRAENKAVVLRFYDEVWNKGNVPFADEVFAPDYVRHGHSSSRALPSPVELQQQVFDFRYAFPDLHFDVEFVVAEDALVTARWTATGTHIASWGGLEPTGLHVTFSGVDIFRFERGKVVELWNHRDDLGLMEQAGPPVYVSARSDL